MILDNIDLKPLNTLIHNHSVDIIISDIFDTILCRKTHPESIKKLVATRLNILFPEISSKNFYLIRKKAEHYCYEHSKIAYGEKEIQYATVISTVYELLKKKYSSKIYLTKSEFYLQHKAFEFTIECHYQISDKQIINFLRTQKNKGKKIILLSDFYMNSDLVNNMLTHHNIQDIYDHLIISCDFMKTKRSGQLYQTIISNLELCHSQNILMLGDNYDSDIVMAKKFGFKTFYIERKQQKLFYNQQLSSLSKKKCITQIDQLINHPENSLFDHLSLLLLIAISKTYHHCIKHKIKNLYFFAREGKILQDLFDQYQTFIHGKSTRLPITTRYLLVSRRSTAAASLGPLKTEKFNALFRQYTNISIKQFAMSYNFEIKKINQICSKLGIDIELIQPHLPSSEYFIRLKKDPQFIQYYKEFRKKQRNNFLDYLKSINFPLKFKHLYFLDIGWKGSIQDNLNKIFPKKRLHGYYLGLTASGTTHSNNTKEGILFDFRDKNKDYWAYTQNLPLFELILTADHGSVKEYIRKDNDEIIVKLEYENKEKDLFQKIILIHRKIFKNFFTILMMLDHYSLELNAIENYATRLHRKKMFSPNKKEIEWFTDIQIFENFGLFTYSQIGCDIPLKHPIKNLFNLLKSPKNYKRSTFWLSWQLSREGLGFLAYLYRCYFLYLKPILSFKK